jgi:hypothetical protein
LTWIKTRPEQRSADVFAEEATSDSAKTQHLRELHLAKEAAAETKPWKGG